MECNFRELGTDIIYNDLDDRDDPALAVGIGGKIVPELVSIKEVCQDPDNVNIVYLLVDVNGVFNYIPKVTIYYTDFEDKEQAVDISSGLILNYKSSPNSLQSIPFSTACGSQTILLAYDVAQFIPSFPTLYKFTIVLKLYGEFDTSKFDFLQDFPELVETVNIFNSSNPSDTIVFTKGIQAKPYKLYYDSTTGELKLQFYTVGSNKCICNITCVDVTFEDQDLTPCEDEIQEVVVNTSSLVGDPTYVNIVIRDSIGNISDLSYLILLGVTPLAPGLLRKESPTRVDVVPHIAADDLDYIDPKKVQYQIWRYINNTGTAKLVLDWTTKSFKQFTDTDIQPGNTYGYAIRLRGEFKEVSNFSSWATVYIP